jgi:hypothetical protein
MGYGVLSSVQAEFILTRWILPSLEKSGPASIFDV